VASKAPPFEPRIRWVFFNNLLGYSPLKGSLLLEQIQQQVVLVIGSRGDNKAQDAEVIDEDKKYLPEGEFQLHDLFYLIYQREG